MTMIDLAGTIRKLVPFGGSPQQVFYIHVTSPANIGLVTLATVGGQAVMIDSVVEMARTAQPANLTTAAVLGGAAQVVTFISALLATNANLNAIDKQLGWTGTVRLAVGKTIVVDLVGAGPALTDLDFTITYHSESPGGVLS